MARIVFVAVLAFLLNATGAWAQCTGAGGVPFNCADDGSAVVAGSLFMAGNPSTGKSVRYTADEIAAFTRAGVTVTSATGSTALTATDRHVCVLHSAPVTITLEASPATGAVQTVADCAGAAATYAITVQAASGTVLGAADVSMTQAYMSLDFVYTRTGWVLQ